MTRFQDNREKILRVESDICAKVLKRLHKEKLAASRWLAYQAGQTQFEVKNGLQSFTIDLATSHCSCKKWDISGISCAHAITCIFFNRQDVKQYVHLCYHVSTYKACYEPIIAPINGHNMWRPSGVTLVQLPIKRRPLIRPKKKRAREPNKPTSRRAGISKQCKACGKLGHNRRSCKGEIGGNSSLPSTTNRTSTSNKEIYGHVCEIVVFQVHLIMCVNFLFVGQHAQLQPHSKCTTSVQHAQPIHSKCTIPVQHAQFQARCTTSVQHA